jgi:hypothetical protein
MCEIKLAIDMTSQKFLLNLAAIDIDAFNVKLIYDANLFLIMKSVSLSLFSQQRAGVNTGCRVVETSQRAHIPDSSPLMYQSHLVKNSGTTPV